jgi:bla regulator protein blaR1
LKGPNLVVDAEGITLDEFAKTFLLRLGRRVINKTGIAGKFIFHLEYAPDDDLRRLLPNDPGEPIAPSIFTAVQQQLGLKPEASRAPGEFFVIDHIERPSRN